MIFLDTSILVRYLASDDPRKAIRCERLFRDSQEGRTTLFLTHLAIAETIWVLSKRYRMTKTALAQSFRRLLSTPNILTDDAPTLLEALTFYEENTVSFIDAYHIVFLPHRGITEIYSYDTDFDQVSGITRREP